MIAVLALALVGLGQDPGDLRRAALERTTEGLPRAEPGAWTGRWEDASALPADLRSSYGAALRAYASEDFPQALHHLQVLLAAHPDFPAGLHQLGVVAFRLRRHGDARAAMERFLAHAPGHVGRTRVLGHALYGLGDLEAARAHYARVLAAEPDDVEARFGDALAAWRLFAADEALAGFVAVLAARPDHADAAYWRARALFELERGEPADWLEAARQAARLAPFDPRPVYLEAQMLYELDRSEEAAGARARFDRLDRIARELRSLEGRALLEPGKVELWREIVRLRGALGDRVGLARARQRLALAIAEADGPGADER